MRNVILISELYSSNLGDTVISKISQKLFAKEFGLDHIIQYDISKHRRTLIGRIICRLSKLLGLEDLLNRYLYCATRRDIKRILLNKSIVVFSGGQLFLDFFIPPMLGILDVIKETNTHTYFFACGIGRLRPREISKLKYYLNNNSIRVTVRDGLTFFQENISPNVYACPDVAIKSSDIYGYRNEIRNNVGFGVFDISYYNRNSPNSKMSEEEYIDQCSNSIRQIRNLGYNVTIFTNGSDTDYNVSKIIYNRLIGDNNIYIAKCPKNDIELVEIIKGFSFVIASRLHALIIAYSYNIPFYGFAWDNKLYGFEQTIGLSSGEVVEHVENIQNVNWSKVLCVTHEYKKILFSRHKQLIREIENEINLIYKDEL